MTPPLLRVENLAAGYGRRAIIANISLALRPGDSLGLLGANGCGKTTLLRALAGIIPATAGTIWLDGQKLDEINSKKRARKMAMSPQNPPRPFGMTLFSFTLLGRYPWLSWSGFYSDSDYDQARAALRLTGMEACRDREAQTLSGGEWQRAVLAQVLAQTQGCAQAVLLLDEATASLDPAHAISALNLLEPLRAKGFSLVLAIHDCNLAAIYCTHLLGIKNGATLFYGPCRETFTGENLSALYETPFGIRKHPDLDAPQAYIRFNSHDFHLLPASPGANCREG